MVFCSCRRSRRVSSTCTCFEQIERHQLGHPFIFNVILSILFLIFLSITIKMVQFSFFLWNFSFNKKNRTNQTNKVFSLNQQAKLEFKARVIVGQNTRPPTLFQSRRKFIFNHLRLSSFNTNWKRPDLLTSTVHTNRSRSSSRSRTTTTANQS